MSCQTRVFNFFSFYWNKACWSKCVFFFFHFTFYQNHCLHYYNPFVNITQSVPWISLARVIHECPPSIPFLSAWPPLHLELSHPVPPSLPHGAEFRARAGKTSDQAGTLMHGWTYTTKWPVTGHPFTVFWFSIADSTKEDHFDFWWSLQLCISQ